MTAEPIDPDATAARLRRRAELQAELAALEAQDATARNETVAADTGAQTEVDTHGGAFVRDSVRVRGGHFIGRDFIQIVTQAGPSSTDAEEAKSDRKSVV